MSTFDEMLDRDKWLDAAIFGVEKLPVFDTVDKVPEYHENQELTRGTLDFRRAIDSLRENRVKELEVAIGNADIMRGFDEVMHQKSRGLSRLTDVCLYDYDEEAAERVKDDVLVSDIARGDVAGQNMLIGVELADMMAGGDVYETAQRFIGALPREQQQAWRDKLDHCHTQSDGQALVGELFRNGVVEQYRANKARQEALEAELDDVQSVLAEELPRYALGEELSPELMDRVTKFGTPDELFPSLNRARAAVELVRGWNYGERSKADYEAAVQARFERLKEEDLQPVTSGGNLVSATRLQRMHTDEELMQQARADEGDSYMVSREQIAALADVLSDKDGQLDKGALGAFLLGIDADAQGQQTINSKFIRNAVEAMKGSFLEAADFMNRGNAAAGAIWQGPDMPMVYLDEEGRKSFDRAYSDKVEELRGHLAQMEDRRLDASEKAKLHSWLLTKGGTIVGENVPYMVTGALGSAARLSVVGNAVLGGLANAPAIMNRSIGQAFAEGKKNAEFVGGVKGLAQSWAEAAFVPLPGGSALVNKTLDALARKAISLPGAGKMIGAVWGNGLMRYVATTAGASAGELLGEEVLAQTVQYPVLDFARRAGIDLDKPEWQPFADSWKAFNDDPRQAAATVVYCALMGASGARENAYEAREFAKEYRNLMAAGLKAGSARRLSLQAEQASSAKDMETLLSDMRETYRREVREGDQVALKKRLEKEGESFLDEVEMQMYARSGVRDYVLQRAGILAADKTTTGLNRVTLPNKENPDKPTVVGWTDEQLNAWVEMQHESKMVEAMRDLQARIAGAALGEAELTDADVKGMLVNLRDLPVRALARMQRTGGRVTYAVLKDLAADAREQVAGFVERGMSQGEAYQQMSEIPGVRLGALVNAAESFTQRVEAIVGTPEGEALGIRTVDDASTAVFRLDSVAPGQSVLLFNKGLVTEREMVEDLIERDVVAATAGENAVTSLKALGDMLRRVQSHLMKYEGGMRLLPKDKEPTEMDIVEAFSKLAQSRFLLNHQQYNMPQEAHDTIEYVQKKMVSTQHLVALSRAWDAFARSEEGRAFIEKEGATLEKLMSDAGASVAGQYSRARFTAEAFEAVKLAYEQSVASPEAAQAVLDEYEAEQHELDHPQEQEASIPASASITGEKLPLFDSAPVDQESGEQQLQLGEVEQTGGNLGRNLVGERYVEVGDGSVLGVAEVEGISLSTDVPQFKKKESAVGRVEADEDGTTHELAGGWNANAAPIHVWRRTDGRLEVISGRHRLAHARKNGVKFIQVRVYDESAERDAQWAKLHDVEQNILDNTCNAIDVAYYFRHNPLTMAEAEARGLLPKTRAGEQTAASRIGLTVAANASDNTFTLLVNGRCTAEDAYMACLIATTEEGQQLALESRAGKNGKKNSWEYVTALVRGAEQMQPTDGGMLDLFGNDDAFRESSEKLARYVAAVREGLKARIAVFVNSSKLNRKADVAKELGVKLSTPEDATRLISRLANLDAAYERLDPDLGIPAKADAWDGKSGVPTKLDELAAGSSFSVVGENAANWDKIKHLAFRGRDDGKLRVELDASQAKVSDAAFESRAYHAFEDLVAAGFDETLAEEDAKALADYAAALREFKALELELLTGDVDSSSEAGKELFAKTQAASAKRKALQAAAYDVLERWSLKSGGIYCSLINMPQGAKDRLVEDFMNGRVSDESWEALNKIGQKLFVYLGDVLDFPDLYEAYPELNSLEVWTDDLGVFTRGRLVRDEFGKFSITLNEELLKDVLQMRSTLLHEVQHWIQFKENFAKGGNETMAERLVSTGMEERKQLIQQVKDELDWLNGIDFAKEQLQRIRRILQRPRAILKMSERWAVHEVQDVNVMAAEAVDMMWDEYALMQQMDAALARRFASGPGKMLPVRNAEKVSLYAVEQLLAEIDKMKSRKVANKGRKGELLRRMDGIYGTYQQFVKLDGLNGYALYQRLAGEIEARNVQLRRDWTAAERAARPFNETLEYPGEALVSFSLAEVTADWQNTLHEYLNNPPVPGSPEHTRDMVVSPTPAVMQMVGAKGWDMVITPGVLDKVMKGKHAVSVAALEQLPAALSDPICIAVSDTPGCLEVVTELKEGANNVLVAVQLSSRSSEKKEVKVNRIASMYGKEKITSLLSHPMLYWDKAKARVWMQAYRLQLPAQVLPKRASGRKILKPADLVKYKLATGLSFSLSGRSMIDSVDLGAMAHEEQMQRLVSYARREAARWERTFAKDTPNAKAAEAMGTISSIQGAIMRVLPPAYRPALSAQMRYVEVYARMLESGRVSAKGKLSKEERAALLEQMQVELGPKMEGLKADAARELKHLFVRDWGEANLAQAAARMLNDAADAVERWMIDVELERVERMKERLAPRKLPNGKYDKGKMSADAYKEFMRYCELMEMDADAVGTKMQELEALIAAEEQKPEPDEAKMDKLASSLAELAAYGNLKGKNLEAVRKGVAALTEFVKNERNVWQGKLELERQRAKRAARNMSELMGRGDEVKLAENAEKSEGTARMFYGMGSGLRSLAQMFYGMGGIPGLRTLMDESLEALTRGHIQLGLREQRAYDQLGLFLENTLGLDTETKRNDWMAGLKKKIDTGVQRAGELVTHKLELTQEDAEAWLTLSKEERDEKRQGLLTEAEKTGVDAQNVVYEEDIPLLRDELAKFDDMPGKRKFIRIERSWRNAQSGNIVASRDEILNILLLCEQSEYQQAADENGYTPAVLEQLRAVVGEDVMAYGHEMRRILEGSGLAAVYEAREGIPFPAVQNYWPGKFDLSAKMNEQANALDPTTGTGTRYGMLITRVKHKLKFNLSLGASNVFLAAMAQQNNYICIGELTAKWRRLLSHSNFAMSLKQRLGEKQLRQLKELLNLLDGAGIAESVTQQNLSGLMSRFQSAHAMAVLAGSPITLIKQTSAMLHAGAWEGINPLRVVWHLLKDRAGKGAITYGEIKEMDAFKVRHRDNRYFTEFMQLGRNANWSKLATWARTGMGWIEKMDIACNAASMTALYNIKYEQLQEANVDAADPLSEAEMRSICERAVEQALELAAQPLRRTQKSAMAALSRNALVKSACYMSSESLNKIGMYTAIKQRNGGGVKGRLAALKFLLPMSVAQQATVMVLDMMRGSAPDSADDDWAEWFWLNVATGCTGLGMLQSVPMLGEGVAWATGGYVKTASLGEMLFDFRGAARSARRLYKMSTDSKDYSGWEWAWQMTNAGRIITAGTGIGRGINSTSKVFSEVSGGLQSLNAVVNHVRPIIQRMRSQD